MGWGGAGWDKVGWGGMGGGGVGWAGMRQRTDDERCLGNVWKTSGSSNLALDEGQGEEGAPPGALSRLQPHKAMQQPQCNLRHSKWTQLSCRAWASMLLRLA